MHPFLEACQAVERQMANQLTFAITLSMTVQRFTLGSFETGFKQFENVHYLSFSRNFGKEAGLLAGLEAAQGDYVHRLWMLIFKIHLNCSSRCMQNPRRLRRCQDTTC
ncbi:MAG: hypothetical protein ACLTZB_02445 [Streptococcus salivarius]